MICIFLVSRQLFTCRGHYDLYLLSFSSTGSTFKSPKFLHSFCGKIIVPDCSAEKFLFDWCQYFIYLFIGGGGGVSTMQSDTHCNSTLNGWKLLNLLTQIVTAHTHSLQFTIATPLPYVSVVFGETLGKSNLKLVGISLHSIQSFYLIQRKKKCINFLYGTWFMAVRRLRVFAFLFGSSICFLRNTK
jgi:hypothetical protein